MSDALIKEMNLCPHDINRTKNNCAYCDQEDILRELSSLNQNPIARAGNAFARIFKREPASPFDAAWLNGFVAACRASKMTYVPRDAARWQWWRKNSDEYHPEPSPEGWDEIADKGMSAEKTGGCPDPYCQLMAMHPGDHDDTPPVEIIAIK